MNGLEDSRRHLLGEFSSILLLVPVYIFPCLGIGEGQEVGTEPDNRSILAM